MRRYQSKVKYMDLTLTPIYGAMIMQGLPSEGQKGAFLNALITFAAGEPVEFKDDDVERIFLAIVSMSTKARDLEITEVF